ncbi:nitrite reductase small subunit NirD [Methylomonas rapida]|jgi:nitrite reductase [NAD(P)H], small subunit|uniref:Nitrite reductase small subunit NirD n=1 Tax=Methylomonas rapida TaxID=2963939 RepID=A0ABY7GPE7_9GAMM|nr:nitrite reductase small subunit NirD [Methylomonas rapida]WAR46370.1 nitrite reductase small subunit NirD [Methylomonas rapida]
MKAWIDVCPVDDLQADAGVCALVRGKQIAIFYLSKLPAVYAIGNFDPFSQANVLSRGMVGDLGGKPMLASPMYKQHFELETGVCFENAEVRIPVYPCRIARDRLEIQLTE